MVSRLFISLLLTVVISLDGYAATTTYDYANRTQGTNIWAYQYDGGTTDQLTTSEYNNIEANDGIFQVNSTFVNFTTPTHYFVYKIDQSESLVTELNIFWNGRNSNGHNGSYDGTSLYIYNYSTSSYQLINNSFGTGETTENWNITSSISSYIGGAGNNEVTIAAQAYDTTKSGRSNYIYTDYASITVTSIDPPHHYEIFHDASGKTCASESVTIKACSDAACSSTVNYNTSLNFKVNGVTQASPTLTNGSATLNFNRSIAETVTLSLDGFSITADNAATCDDGAGGSSCSMVFDSVGCLDHYEIQHDGNGSACAAETVTIKACADASCSTLYASATSIDFQKNGVTQSSPSFTGSTTVSFNHTEDANVALSLANPSSAAPNANSCDNTSGGTSCNMNFVTSGCIDHYQLEHDSNGSTCSAETVTIKACANGDCSVLSSLSTAVDFQIDGATISSPSFTGSTAVTFNQDVAENITLGTANPSIAATNTAICLDDGGGNSCVQNFSSAGCSALFAHWEFDEGSGQTASDSSGNGRIGTLGSSASVEASDPSWQCNATGFSLEFNSTESDVVNVAEFVPPSESVIAFWIKTPDTPVSTQKIMGSGMSWEVRYDTDGRIYFDINHDGTLLANLIYTDSVIASNTWTHVAAVQSAANDTWKVYVNGILDISGTSNQTPQAIAAFTLGKSSWQTNQHWQGKLDDVRIYSGTLTAAEVAALATTPPADCPIDHYEIVHDGSGSICQAENVTVKACGNADCSILATQSTSLNLQVDGVTVSSPTFIGSSTVSYNHTVEESVTLTIDSPSIAAANADVCDNTSGGSSCVQTFSNADCPACNSIFPSAFATSSGSTIDLIGNPTIDDNTNGVLTTNSLNVTGSPSCLDGVGQTCSQSGSNASALTLPENSSTTDITTSTNFTSGDYFYRAMALDGGENITTSGGGTARLYFNSSIDIDGNSNINAAGTPSQIAIFVDGDINMTGTGTYNAIFYATGQIIISGTGEINGGVSAESGIIISGSPDVTYFSSYIDNADLGGFCQASIATIHHYQIDHDDSGLTCAAEPITIKACLDANCGFLSDNSVGLDFQADGVTKSSPTFTGSTVVNLSQTTPDTLTLGVINATLTATNGVICNDGSIGSCDLTFADTGFQFLVNGNAVNIGTQLSGKPSNIGYNSATLSLQAIKTSPVTGACEAAITSNVTIEMLAECTNPDTCAGQSVVIDSTAISTVDNTVTPTPYTNVSMDFGNSSDNTADFTFTYPDAGRVQLHARYNIPVDGVPSGNYMVGSSNAFVVRPFGFYLDIPGNAAAIDHTEGVFKKAGENFTTTLTAVQWQAADDDGSIADSLANDGIPDSNDDLLDNVSGGLITVNFGNESTPESAVISHELLLPFGGNKPDLSENTFSFVNGASTRNDINWPEVGILSFSAGLFDNQYIGTSNVVGTVANVGRFTPDHFELAITEQGSLIHTCEATLAVMAYVYNGEMSIATPANGAIQYGAALAPEFSITAKSSICPAGVCTTTQNYTGNFMRMLNTGITRVTPFTDGTKVGVDAVNKVNLVADLNAVTLSESTGVITYQFDSNDNFVYTHEANSEVIPFVADIDLQITSVIDQDLVSANDANGADSGVLTLNPIGMEVRFGRLVIDNSYGPETANLPQTLTTQYVDINGNYITNTDDSCTSLLHSNGGIENFSMNNISLNPALSGINDVNERLVDGLSRTFELTAPGEGNRGEIGVSYDTYDWLKYDWDKDGAYDDNPSAVATFGLFRGNDRIIYWREVNN